MIVLCSKRLPRTTENSKQTDLRTGYEERFLQFMWVQFNSLWLFTSNIHLNIIFKFVPHRNHTPSQWQPPICSSCLEKQSLFIARSTQNRQIQSLGRMQSVSTLKQMVYIITTEQNTRRLWKPIIHYRVHKRPQLGPILSQRNPVHILIPCLCKSHFWPTKRRRPMWPH